MKLLLTSGGVTNKSIENALVELLGKPISECNALACSTASHVLSNGAKMARNFYAGTETNRMTSLGWKSVGVLELSALPTISQEIWQQQLQEADALLVNGGDPLYLNYWMQTSGVADLFQSLDNLVYVGLSAGSMIMAPRIGKEFVGWQQPNNTDETLGLIDFSIFPHLDHPLLTENTMAAAIEWSENLGNPGYAIDEETAIRIVDKKVDVISEGNWRIL